MATPFLIIIYVFGIKLNLQCVKRMSKDQIG